MITGTNNPAMGSVDDGRGQLSGFFRGRVEDNKDPLHIGRIKVRVPKHHGATGDGSQNSTTKDMKDDTSADQSQNTTSTSPAIAKSTDDKTAEKDTKKSTAVETKGLPWASPVTPTGSGRNHGSLMIPDIGDYVFISYEDGDRNKPIYFGGCYGRGADEKECGDNIEPSNPDPLLYNGKGWNEPKNLNEVPEEVYPYGSNSPTGKVVYKSPKGATIWVQEKDEEEFLQILDRLGQSIKLSSPVAKLYNEHNALARGGADASSFSSYPAYYCPNKESTIEIEDLGHQKIIMTGRYPRTKSDIKILSSDRRTSITISNKYITLGTNPVTKDQLKDLKPADQDTVDTSANGIILRINRESNTIELISDNISMTAPNISIKGNITMNGNMSMDGSLSTKGIALDGSGNVSGNWDVSGNISAANKHC